MVVSVFKVNTPISVVIRVEDDKGQVLYQAANQDVEGESELAFLLDCLVRRLDRLFLRGN